MVAVLVALSLVSVVGVLAFAMDGGMMMAEQRHAQAVADATAHAAACVLYATDPTNGTDPQGKAKPAALAIAAANGYANDGTKSTVVVNIPPKSGLFAGKASYAEVVVTYKQPRYFAAIWGSGTTAIGARSVARGKALGGGAPPSIILLDPSAAGSLTVTGSGRITAQGGIQVNSSSFHLNSDNNGAVNASNGAFITAPSINIKGNYNIPSWATSATFFSKTPVPGASTVPDPLASLPVPPATGNSFGSVSTGNGVYKNLTAGVYDSLSINSPGATLGAGVYYIKSGGLTIANGAQVTGSNVTIYLDSSNPNGTSAALSFQGGGTINLSAPTTGTYANVLVYQDRANNRPISIANGSTTTMTGTIYAAGAQVNLAGGSSNSQFGTQYVVKNLNVSNNANIAINTTATNAAATSPGQRQLGLVE